VVGQVERLRGNVMILCGFGEADGVAVSCEDAGAAESEATRDFTPKADRRPGDRDRRSVEVQASLECLLRKR
jgi:hypothetical protein